MTPGGPGQHRDGHDTVMAVDGLVVPGTVLLQQCSGAVARM